MVSPEAIICRTAADGVMPSVVTASFHSLAMPRRCSAVVPVWKLASELPRAASVLRALSAVAAGF